MRKVLLGISLLTIMLASSCITHKNLLLYPEETGSTQSNYPMEAHKIQPNDMLFISAFSYDRESKTIPYVNRTPQQQQGNNVNPILIYVRSLLVDLKGEISLPLLGKVQAGGLTIEELRGNLNEKIAEISDSISYFDIKLMNFRVSVLGEVKTSGVYYFYEQKVTLLQAISQTGGLTDLANIKRVKITRETPNGIVSTYLDLSKPECVSSDFFFLRTNDVIYIEPLKIKAVRLNAQVLTLTFSAVSLSVSLILLVNNLTRSK